MEITNVTQLNKELKKRKLSFAYCIVKIPKMICKKNRF